jgi:hypothetical protein
VDSAHFFAPFYVTSTNQLERGMQNITSVLIGWYPVKGHLYIQGSAFLTVLHVLDQTKMIHSLKSLFFTANKERISTLQMKI